MDPARAIMKDGGEGPHRRRRGGIMIGDQTMDMSVARARHAMTIAATARIGAMVIASIAMVSASGSRIVKVQPAQV